MFTPVVERFESPLTPWEVFKRVYAASDTCFFLDSHNFQPPNQAYSYIGFNPFLSLKLTKQELVLEGGESSRHPASELFPVLRRIMRKYKSHDASRYEFLSGGLIGFWGYELVELFEKIKLRKKQPSHMPLLELGVYQDLIVYEHQTGHYRLVTNVYSSKKLPQQEARLKAKPKIKALKRVFEERERDQQEYERFELRSFHPDISRQVFKAMVRKAKTYIREGDIYQANLSQRFSFQFEGSVLELYEQLRGINPSPFASLIKMGDRHLVSSSPERLIQKRGSHCETQPIAGTRPRRTKDQSEEELEQELLSNEKERAEHIMMVDLERNDLGRVCDWPSVQVKEMLAIEKYSHVMHLVSRITGNIKPDCDVFDLIRAMFPGGTITGCPKVRCMEIIDELEPSDRGAYTGSIGYIDFKGDLDLNIVIRTLALEKSKGFFQVGAGIVHDSDPGKEYEETLHKGKALTQALVQASSKQSLAHAL